MKRSLSTLGTAKAALGSYRKPPSGLASSWEAERSIPAELNLGLLSYQLRVLIVPTSCL